MKLRRERKRERMEFSSQFKYIEQIIKTMKAVETQHRENIIRFNK